MESDKLMEELGVTMDELNAAEVEIRPQCGLRCTAQRDGEGNYTLGVMACTNWNGTVDVLFDSDGVREEYIKMDSVKLEFVSVAQEKKLKLKELKQPKEKESSRLEEEVQSLWKMFEVSDDNIKSFKEKVEAASKLKQARLSLLKEERDRLWDMESEKLMEELGVTVEDLDPKPTDAESTNNALKDLKKQRKEESVAKKPS